MPVDQWGLVPILAIAYAIASRIAYVLFVGISLKRQDQSSIYTRSLGPVEAFQRFRRRAAFVMNNDGVAFTVLCLLTRGTVSLPVSATVSSITGAALVLVGIGTKLWAARTLGSDAYYWRNFFDPVAARSPAATGPYRFLSNPMYTIGYLQTYGLALIFRSLPGLFASAFAQLAILTLYWTVEKPHFKRLHRSS